MREINVSATGVLPLVVAPFLYYRGFSLRETTGVAAALVRIFDGTTATGTVLDEIAFNSGQSVRECYSPPKIAKIGIYVQVLSGAVTGSLQVD